jgi:hypothetical protein
MCVFLRFEKYARLYFIRSGFQACIVVQIHYFMRVHGFKLRPNCDIMRNYNRFSLLTVSALVPDHLSLIFEPFALYSILSYVSREYLRPPFLIARYVWLCSLERSTTTCVVCSIFAKKSSG